MKDNNQLDIFKKEAPSVSKAFDSLINEIL